MRHVVAALSMAALAVAGTASAGGQKCAQEAKIARAMAVAEVDFELHRAQLGLLGSSLLSEERQPSVSRTSTSESPGATSPEPNAAPAAAADPRK